MSGLSLSLSLVRLVTLVRLLGLLGLLGLLSLMYLVEHGVARVDAAVWGGQWGQGLVMLLLLGLVGGLRCGLCREGAVLLKLHQRLLVVLLQLLGVVLLPWVTQHQVLPGGQHLVQ